VRRLSAALACLAFLAAPAVAAAQASSITCAASVTHDLGPRQTVKDLKPSILPIVPFGTKPQDREFKHVATIDGAAIGLFVYRVSDGLAHMQLFEREASGNAVLADTALKNDITELSYRSLGGSDLVTAYCYW
jgi:hypothetical protein